VSRPIRTFVRHYAEMVVAMFLGMMVLYPPWLWATSDVTSGWLDRSETEALVMATSMAIPMALWMRFRGHGFVPTLEMCLAMYAGFVVLFPFLWWGGLTGDDMVTVGHVLMLVFMLVAMLLRRSEYAGHHHDPARQIQPWSRAAR
jgi:hypothetical protein